MVQNVVVDLNARNFSFISFYASLKERYIFLSFFLFSVLWVRNDCVSKSETQTCKFRGTCFTYIVFFLKLDVKPIARDADCALQLRLRFGLETQVSSFLKILRNFSKYESMTFKIRETSGFVLNIRFAIHKIVFQLSNYGTNLCRPIKLSNLQLVIIQVLLEERHFFLCSIEKHYLTFEVNVMWFTPFEI